jgi:chromosomal replication initiation ATPase DnaA
MIFFNFHLKKRENGFKIVLSLTSQVNADSIINVVCKFYNVIMDELYRSRRGQFNEPGNAAIFLTRKLRRDSLSEIGRQFQMEKYSSISSIIEKTKGQILKDRNFKKHADSVGNMVNKSQEQT